METISGTEVEIKEEMSAGIDLLKEELEKVEEVRPDFTPERLPDESFEDYKERRKAVKKWSKRVRFTPDDEGLNRNARRDKTEPGTCSMSMFNQSIKNPFRKRLRLTKPIKKIRGKYTYGMIRDDDNKLITNDITEAFEKDINPTQYARMRKMGLTLKQYLSIAKNTEKNLNEMLKDNEKFKEFKKAVKKEGETDVECK